MFFKIQSVVVICAIFVYCEPAFVDTLDKCRIDDGECQKNLLQKVFKEIAKIGIPELGIPSIDPYVIRNVSVSILNVIDITMVDGIAKGIKNCVVNKMETELERDHATMEITCDLTIKGKYKVFSDSSLVKDLFGGKYVHGEGLGKVRLEKLHLKFDYRIFVRNFDGELYFDCQYKDMKHQHSIGKAAFAANNLFLGDQEASKIVVGFLNDNWKFVMDTFGKSFVDKAVEIIYSHARKFFITVPAKHFILDDLTPYVKH